MFGIFEAMNLAEMHHQEVTFQTALAKRTGEFGEIPDLCSEHGVSPDEITKNVYGKFNCITGTSRVNPNSPPSASPSYSNLGTILPLQSSRSNQHPTFICTQNDVMSCFSSAPGHEKSKTLLLMYSYNICILVSR